MFLYMLCHKHAYTFCQCGAKTNEVCDIKQQMKSQIHNVTISLDLHDIYYLSEYFSYGEIKVIYQVRGFIFLLTLF